MPDIERSMKLINLVRLIKLVRLIRLVRLDFLMRVLPGFLCGVRPVSNLAW